MAEPEMVIAAPGGPRTLLTSTIPLPMTRYASRQHISCHPDEAWAVLSAVERWPEWCPTVRSVVLHGAGMTTGAHVHIEQPGLRPAIWRVREWDPPTGFSWESRHPGVRIVGRHHIEPEADGCLAELALEFSGLLALLAKPLFGVLARRYLRQELDALKSECVRRNKTELP